MIRFSTISLLLIPILHVLVSPYTKVEESFTLHAAHDVLRYGFNPSTLALWDHRTFPGAVPRSFLPPVILAFLSWPSAAITVALGLVTTPLGIQTTIRITLAVIMSLSYVHLARTLRVRYSSSVSNFFIALSLVQFHVPYYAGRTIPNFTALPLVVFSISLLLRGSYDQHAIVLLTAAATVIRLEIALVVIPICISLVILGRLTILRSLRAGALGGMGSLAISAPLDYCLWSPTFPHPSLPNFTAAHSLWPELAAMHFNIVGGHAAEWGVEPFHYYILNALPKLLAGALPLTACGIAWATLTVITGVETGILGNKTLSRGVFDVGKLFGFAVFTVLGALSAIGHKEWRFIVYIVPIFTIIASLSASALWHYPSRGFRLLLRIGVFAIFVASILFTLLSTMISMMNYPGGQVWEKLDALGVEANSTIHFQSYPLQTGATLFTFSHASLPSALAFPKQQEPVWLYSKSEEPALLTPIGAWDAGIDYVVTGDWDTYTSAIGYGGRPIWEVVDQIAGVHKVHPLKFVVISAPKLAILRRRN